MLLSQYQAISKAYYSKIVIVANGITVTAKSMFRALCTEPFGYPEGLTVAVKTKCRYYCKELF